MPSELRRDVLYVLARFRCSGWATAGDDIVTRLHGHDGRRVAGALRTLKRQGLVESRPSTWRDFHDDPMHDYTAKQEWRITTTGIATLRMWAQLKPRLGDDTVEVCDARMKRDAEAAARAEIRKLRTRATTMRRHLCVVR